MANDETAFGEAHAFAEPKFAGIASDAPKRQPRGAEQFHRHRRKGDFELIPVAAGGQVGNGFDEMGHYSKLGR